MLLQLLKHDKSLEVYIVKEACFYVEYYLVTLFQDIPQLDSFSQRATTQVIT